jgi:hypothetical protein
LAARGHAAAAGFRISVIVQLTRVAATCSAFEVERTVTEIE